MFDNYEVELEFAAIDRRTMLLNGRQIEHGKGKKQFILLDIEDIAEIKKKVEKLEQFHRLPVGRKQKMIELKQKINELSTQLGIGPQYNWIF